MSNLLNIGVTGLLASKKSLETTGHNISNANTEGYSRQRVHQTTGIPIVKQGLVQGTGTRVNSVTRVHDEFIEKRLNLNISNHNFYQARADQLGQVEDIFNEIDGDGLNQILNKFYNSFRELANQPENETIRSVVRDNANLVVKDFRRIRETLDGLAENIDQRITGGITDINDRLKRISNLNKKIAQLEALGDETGDLRDQRDMAVRGLSEDFQVHTYTDNRGNFIVNALGVGTLVSGGNVQELAAGTLDEANSSNNMPGSVEVYFKNRPAQPITKNFKNGRLTGLIKVRNDDIQNLQNKTDDIAYEFGMTVNAVHRRGFVQRPIPVDAAGNPASFDAKGPVTGIDFFSVPVERKNAAKNLKLSRSVESDLSNIATGLAPNSPGDNRVALGISKLQHERVMDGGTATLEESYLQTIGNVGLESGKAQLDREQSDGILAQTKNLKERLSGVSIDEEAANMVRYQHAYDASAKVMQTANEMFDTVLSIKR